MSQVVMIAPLHYQVPMRAAGESVGIIKLDGRWTLVHPRLSNETYKSFTVACFEALKFARKIEG